MSQSDFCPGCGFEHHWLACPEVRQSVFDGEDPETAAEELTELEDELRAPELLEDEVRELMLLRFFELVDFIEAEARRREAPLVARVEANQRKWERALRPVFDLLRGTPVAPPEAPAGQELS